MIYLIMKDWMLFFLRLGSQKVCLLLTLLFNIVLEVLTIAKKEIKVCRFSSESTYLFYCLPPLVTMEVS